MLAERWCLGRIHHIPARQTVGISPRLFPDSRTFVSTMCICKASVVVRKKGAERLIGQLKVGRDANVADAATAFKMERKLVQIITVPFQPVLTREKSRPVRHSRTHWQTERLHEGRRQRDVPSRDPQWIYEPCLCNSSARSTICFYLEGAFSCFMSGHAQLSQNSSLGGPRSAQRTCWYIWITSQFLGR